LLASLKTLTNSKSFSESYIKFLFPLLSFALIGQLFLVYIHSRLSEQFSESQAGFGTTFKGTGGYQKAGTNSMKRLLEGISQLGSDFIEASRNFILDFLHKKTTENCENHNRSFKKYCFEF
jgi:hypothetical protein